MQDAQVCKLIVPLKRKYQSKSYLIRVEHHFCAIMQPMQVRKIKFYLTLIFTLHKYREMTEKLYYKILYLEFQQNLANQLMKIMKY